MNFQWIDCHFFLKKLVSNTQVTLNLNPFYKLQYINSESETRDINYDVTVSFQKPLMFDKNIGWNWHKSWNIPDITVQLKADSWEGLEVAKSLKGLKAEIYTVKPVFSKQYSMYIEDMQMEGSTCHSLKNSQARFQSLRFSATSYNSEGSKFHFLIVIYQQSLQSDQEWRVLVSKISTPVFVDSRKSAREADLIKLKKISSFVQPFEISSLEKNYIRKQCKKQRDIFQQQIHNNIEGLCSYLGAANIRNKIKHPLFLAFKFSSTFEIYINSNYNSNFKYNSQPNPLSQSAHVPHRTISWIQQTLQQSYQQIQSPKLNNIKTQNKKIIILVRGKFQESKSTLVKKIIQFIQAIQTQYIEIFHDHNRIPPNFIKLLANEQLLKQYNEVKNKLILNHISLYKLKQSSLKKEFVQINQSPTSVEQIKVQESVQPIIQQKQKQNSNQQISQYNQGQQSSSLSSSPFWNESLNIPLKCQIHIDPIKKKPLSMNQIIKLHNNSHKSVKNYIKYQKSKEINQKQLGILNSLMKQEISRIRQMFIKNSRINNTNYCKKQYIEESRSQH